MALTLLREATQLENTPVFQQIDAVVEVGMVEVAPVFQSLEGPVQIAEVSVSVDFNLRT